LCISGDSSLTADLPNLRHVRLALSITEGISLRAAAKSHRLTQPAASLAIGALETFYGAALFERRPNRLATTKAGQALAHRALRCMFFLGNAISVAGKSEETGPMTRVMANMTTAQLTAIAAMHQHDSFRSASEFAGLRPATLQKSIRALEGNLGCSLVDRHRTGAQLNIAGRIFSSWAGRAVAELAAIAADIEALEGHISGTVSVGAIRVSAAELVPQAIAKVLSAAPAARFVVMQANYQIMMEALRGGTIDFLCSTVRDVIPPDVDGEVLGNAKLHIFCSREHDFARRENVSLEELAASKWIGPSPLTGAVRAFRRMFEERGIAPPSFAVETTSTDVTEYLVRTGLFLAIGNTTLRPSQMANDLRLLDVGELNLVRPMWLLYRKGWQPTKLQQLFRDAFHELFPLAAD